MKDESTFNNVVLPVPVPPEIRILRRASTQARSNSRGDVGGDPLAALRALPGTPTGANTDIGAGIAAGIAELERPDAKPVGAIALVTDGLIDTGRGSAYATADAPAWGDLRTRAEAVAARHEIAAYALALVTETDAALLKTPFPKAEVVPADQLSTKLGDLRAQLLAFQAAERVRPDLDRPVTATWAGIDWAKVSPGEHPATLRLASGTAQIPLQVTDLAAASSGGVSVDVTGLPATVDLAPGATVDVPVTVRVGNQAGATASVTLTGKVTSPWKDVLTRDLGLAFAPTLSAPTVQVTTPTTPAGPVPVTTSLPVLPLVGGGIALVALAALVLLLVRARAPRLVGSMMVTREGRVVREFLLAGRSANLGAQGVEGLTGTVSARRSKTGEPGIAVDARAGGVRTRETLGDLGTLTIGDYTLAYTSHHTRMLSIINSGEASEAAASDAAPPPED